MKKEKTPGSSSTNEDDGDDAEAMEQHLSELGKEVKKKNPDSDKVARLLSLTYSTRRTYMMSQTASTRTSAALQQYECLKKPIFVRYMYIEI